MLSANVIKLLNDQMNLEFYSSNLYLQMSAWCEQQGFEGAAKFLSAHAAEEMQHMRKLFTYLNETGAQAIISAIEAPSHEYKSLKEVIEITYEHEKLITSNQAVVECDFYHPDNIFIWDGESLDGLEDFFRRPYHPVSEEIKNKYAFGNWVRRILDISDKA